MHQENFSFLNGSGRWKCTTVSNSYCSKGHRSHLPRLSCGSHFNNEPGHNISSLHLSKTATNRSLETLHLSWWFQESFTGSRSKSIAACTGENSWTVRNTMGHKPLRQLQDHLESKISPNGWSPPLVFQPAVSYKLFESCYKLLWTDGASCGFSFNLAFWDTSRWPRYRMRLSKWTGCAASTELAAYCSPFGRGLQDELSYLNRM